MRDLISILVLVVLTAPFWGIALIGAIYVAGRLRGGFSGLLSDHWWEQP